MIALVMLMIAAALKPAGPPVITADLGSLLGGSRFATENEAP